MELDEATLKSMKIFHPGLLEELMVVVNEQKRFAYYTSAETAMKVMKNQELWFRNATVMNDFSEIAYGLDLIQSAFSGPEGNEFWEAIEDIFTGTTSRTKELLSGWQDDWRHETYLACVSIHDSDEDQRGRLSMWRAYGDTALIVNATPMTAVTDLLAVHSIPVLYISEIELTAQIVQISRAIQSNKDYLQTLGRERLVDHIHYMLFRFAIASKHPGFAEEKEWRLFYRPTQRRSPAMLKETVVLGGVPQNIFKLRLANEPEIGLHGADIPSLIDRIIIGPTEFPYVSYTAFVGVLNDLGVADAGSKVVVSDIPLRTR